MFSDEFVPCKVKSLNANGLVLNYILLANYDEEYFTRAYITKEIADDLISSDLASYEASRLIRRFDTATLKYKYQYK